MSRLPAQTMSWHLKRRKCSINSCLRNTECSQLWPSQPAEGSVMSCLMNKILKERVQSQALKIGMKGQLKRWFNVSTIQNITQFTVIHSLHLVQNRCHQVVNVDTGFFFFLLVNKWILGQKLPLDLPSVNIVKGIRFFAIHLTVQCVSVTLVVSSPEVREGAQSRAPAYHA